MSARVLITGAASGIGAGTVEMLRARGALVAGLDLNASGDIIACDVRDQDSVDGAVAEAVDRLGGLDVVINNAGIGEPQSAIAPPGDDAQRVLDVNLLGPWRVTGAAMPALTESRGRVINVASGLAHITVPFATAYCMSKRGIVAYSDALRAEYGDVISVTTVYPGYIRTPIHESAGAHGISLEGLVPAEELDDAVRVMVRAALGRPARDLATTRMGTVGYALARATPRGLLDGIMRRRMRRAIVRGDFDASEMAGDLRTRVRGTSRG